MTYNQKLRDEYSWQDVKPQMLNVGIKLHSNYRGLKVIILHHPMSVISDGASEVTMLLRQIVPITLFFLCVFFPTFLRWNGSTCAPESPERHSHL